MPTESLQKNKIIIAKDSKNGNNSSEQKHSTPDKHQSKEEKKKGIKTSKSENECEVCKEIMEPLQFGFHSTYCKIYFQYMKKLQKGFECQICSFKIQSNGIGYSAGHNAKFEMYHHLKQKHSDKIVISKSFDKKQCHFCKDMISDNLFANHVQSCQEYATFMTKYSNGYSCNLCSFKDETNEAFMVLKNHVKSCNLYSNFMTKSSGGYSCKLCSFKTRGFISLQSPKARSQMNGHIKANLTLFVKI